MTSRQLISRRALCIGVFLSIFAVHASAQTPEARCEKLLPNATLSSIAGGGFALTRAKEKAPGELERSWLKLGSGSLRTFSINHSSLSALNENVKTFTPARSSEAQWASMVDSTESAFKAKRKLMDGLGKNAALVEYHGSQIKSFVLRESGLHSLVTSGESTARMTKIAKALVTP